MIPVLRDATTADAALVARLTREAWAGRVAADSSGHHEAEARVIEDLAAGGGLVMEVAGEPAGSVRWRDRGSHWEVVRLGLRPAFRGRGLGTWLLNEVALRAHLANADELRAAVRHDQPALAAWYERQGYVRDPSLAYSRANPDNPPPVVLRRPLHPVAPVRGVLS